jgi:hypothetical protein
VFVHETPLFVLVEIDAVPLPTATHVPPPHAMLLIAAGMLAGLVFVQLTLSVDVRMLNAVLEPAIHVFPPHAMERAPPAVAALDVNVQFTASGDVIMPLFAAAAQIVPFHAIIKIGSEPGSENPVADASIHVLVGSAV